MKKMIYERILRYVIHKASSLIDTFSLEPKRIISHDRSILEEIILPDLAKTTSYRRILFVGCSAYTQWYEGLFKAKEYWTIDPKKAKRKYGSERHIVDSITNVGKYVAEEYFDVIIMNGVIGFGLNRVSAIEQAVDASYDVLAGQGILLVGWNDMRRRTPMDLRVIRSLSKFREYYFEPLQTCHFRAEGTHRHTFSFYRKE
jgi:hypothetical protein